MSASNALGFAPSSSLVSGLSAVTNSPYSGANFSGAPADQAFQGDVDVAGTITGQYGRFIGQGGGGTLLLTATTDSCSGVIANGSGVLDVIAVGSRTPTDFSGLTIVAGQSGGGPFLNARDSTLAYPAVQINNLKIGPSGGPYTVAYAGTIDAALPTGLTLSSFTLTIGPNAAPSANYYAWVRVPDNSIPLSAVVVMSPLNSSASTTFSSMFGYIQTIDGSGTPGTYVYVEVNMDVGITTSITVNVRVIW